MSAGLDSAVLLDRALQAYRSVQPLYVRAGLRWEPVEVHFLKRFLRSQRSVRLRPLAFIELPMGDLYDGHWSTTGRGSPGFDAGDASVYLPGRNLALFSKSATFCALRGIPVLLTGILSANPFPDGTPSFIRTMQSALTQGLGRPIRLLAPFRRLTKDRIVRRGRGLPLHLTFSCIAPQGSLHCGRCCKCAERMQAFERAGIVDATRYARGAKRRYADGSGSLSASSVRGSRRRPGSALDRTTRDAPKTTTSTR
jgi:7-cyano-7-deazaguanine synthase